MLRVHSSYSTSNIVHEIIRARALTQARLAAGQRQVHLLLPELPLSEPGRKGLESLARMQCCACLARALLCAVRLTVRAVRAAGAQGAACGWSLASGAAAGAPALLAIGSRRAPRTLQRQRQYRVAGWRGPGSGLTWFSCLPAFPRPFPASEVPVNPPPPPSPLVFFSVFSQTKKHVFFSVF